MSNDFLSDLESDDLDAIEAGNEQALAQQGQTYAETCKKCGGSGVVHFGFIHARTGTCFACKGKGHITRKTSPEARAKARTNNVLRKANTEAGNWAAFAAEHTEAARWIDEAAVRFDFARNMGDAVKKFGSLTERQFAAVLKCMASDKARAEAAPVVDTAALEEYFGKVGERAKLRFEKFAVSRAPVTGRNAGALYVKSSDTYLGKIQGGKFFASRDCSADVTTEIGTVIADPLAAAVAYGRRTGNCCVCGRQLTDPQSIEAGIGPICAAGF